MWWSLFDKPWQDWAKWIMSPKTARITMLRGLMNEQWELRKNNGWKKSDYEIFTDHWQNRINDCEKWIRILKKPKQLINKDAVKLVPIQNVLDIQFRKLGNRLVGKCPMHNEKTGSFYVYLDQNTWACYGSCATGGDVIELVMKTQKLSFTEALKYLSKFA